MLDRESTFANADIIKFLQTKVVPVAIDQSYQRRQKDTEGDFYRRIVQQSPRKDFGNGTTQGLYMASPDGTYLGFTNNRNPDRVMGMLQDAWNRRVLTNTAPLIAETRDAQFHPKLADGGLIVRVQAKILSGYDEPDTQFQQIFQTAVSRDNLWITPQEHQSLVAGSVPDLLARRIAQYHLIDNTRGEPPMWKTDEVRTVEFSIKDDSVTGHVELRTASGDRSYVCDLRGRMEVTNGAVTKLNLVALGTFSGEGVYTKNAPKQPFPLAISFTLADGTDMADSIPPQAARGWLDGYLKARQ